MWTNKSRDRENYEMLDRAAASRGKGCGDVDVRAIQTVKYKEESYQSTARILVWALCVITGLLLILTSTTIGTAVCSDRKSVFNIQGIMPSINLASGDCDSLKLPNLILVLFVNFVGTIVIGASNYLQQSKVLLRLS